MNLNRDMEVLFAVGFALALAGFFLICVSLLLPPSKPKTEIAS